MVESRIRSLPEAYNVYHRLKRYMVTYRKSDLGLVEFLPALTRGVKDVYQKMGYKPEPVTFEQFIHYYDLHLEVN